MKTSIKFLLLAIFFLIVIPQIGQTAASDINLTIRNGNQIVFAGAVPLNASGSVNLIDSNGNSHSVNGQSVLSVLNNADASSSDFSISELIYYESFGSLYLKCIKDNAGNQCDNWQYTVNDSYPNVGMDAKILSGGENVYLYFGPQHRIILSSSSIYTDGFLIATAQNYNYQNDTWVERTGITVGLTQPDPNNPWSPIELQTIPVDSSGMATFSSISEGSYNIGVKEDFYFPVESLLVSPPPIRSGGGPAFYVAPIEKEKKIFDFEKALTFLAFQQKEDGSFFEEDLYADWVGIALASSENFYREKFKLAKFFYEDKPESYQLTDYERRSMALMALGINPYNVNGEDYIEKIISFFDGKQFGDPNMDNDDIFALVVLQNVGYASLDEIISTDIKFILSRQKEDGSWDNSVDLTGAGIEALAAFKSEAEVEEALNQAKQYLKRNQKNDGGLGNVSSTAWAMEGILALGEKPEDWIKNGNTPVDFLILNQETDGGIKGDSEENRVWQTAYAISIMSGKPWNQIMQKFEKPKIEGVKSPAKEIGKAKEVPEKKKAEVQKTASPTIPEKIKTETSESETDSSALVAIATEAIPQNTKVLEPVRKQNWLRLLFFVFRL